MPGTSIADDDSARVPAKAYAQVKVLSLGDSCVGKSCLIKRYCEKKFITKYISTIGIDFGVRAYALPAPAAPPPRGAAAALPSLSPSSSSPPSPFTLKLNFFDLSGSAVYRSIRSAFLVPQPHLLLLCFDVNVRRSFDRLLSWLSEAGLAGETGGDEQQQRPVVCVCGCMSGEEGVADEEEDGVDGGLSSRRARQVSETEGRGWSTARGFLYFDVSAKTGRNVDEMFDAALSLLAQRSYY